MTDLAVLRAEAAAARQAAAGGANAVPAEHRTTQEEFDHRDVTFKSELRSGKASVNGQDWYRVEGYASVFETPYDMWDEFGPYTEVVSKGAADKTLSQKPFVIFRWNHGGTAMANTRNGRLELEADDTGLRISALLNPARDDVQLLMHAMSDDDVTEQSFMFTIERGVWSPDYTEYRIEEFNLDRGDVGPVQYGANPYTSIAARSGEILAALRGLPPLAKREARQILGEDTEIVLAAPEFRGDKEELKQALEARSPVFYTEDGGVFISEEPKPVQVKPLPKHEGRSVATWRNILLADDEL